MLEVLNKVPRAINETYTQYPGEKSPAELFGGTWTPLFENEGVFFRTPGGSALAFNGGIQNAANTAHNHDRGNMDITGELWATNDQQMRTRAFGWAGGALYLDQSGTNASSPGHWGHNTPGAGMARFSAARAWSGRTSADGVADGRPKNRTCRLWKRIG